MKSVASILFFFLTISSFGQFGIDKTKISSQTEKIVAKIEKVDEVMGNAVGEGGIQPEQYDHFIELQKTATKDELMELTNHPNGVVRCYSFWALSYDREINLLPIVVQHIYDNEFVKTQFGCRGGQERVGDFFIGRLTIKYVDSISQKLTNAEFRRLDSFLIYTPNNLWARTDAINRARRTEELYTRLRELVIKENYLDALPVLAEFQKENDIDLILNSREFYRNDEAGYYYTYQAIMNFPRPEFMPLLEKNLTNTWDETHIPAEGKKLYAAIAAYKNDKAAELLSRAFTNVVHEGIKEYHLDFLYDAVIEYIDTVYNDILWRLWESKHPITIEAYSYFLKNDPRKTYAFTIRELKGARTIKHPGFDPVYDESIITDDIDETMFNFLFRNDKELAFRIIEDQIKSADNYSFSIYSDLVSKLKDGRFIKPLFKRLKKEDDRSVYLDIVKALISYNNETINKQIIETRKINPNLNKGWGGEELDELLKKNNIK